MATKKKTKQVENIATLKNIETLQGSSHQYNKFKYDSVKGNIYFEDQNYIYLVSSAHEIFDRIFNNTITKYNDEINNTVNKTFNQKSISDDSKEYDLNAK